MLPPARQGETKAGKKLFFDNIESENNSNFEPSNLHLKKRMVKKMEPITSRG